ncbi:N-6 DNA methylase, partial [Bacteroides heparinolyticus]
VGDTLADPQFKQYGMVSTFDVCVANPPFSMKNWLASGMENDQYNRWTANLLPPAKCGDYAFLLHLIASMKTDEGRGACILPHGVLFRGNAEYDIRKHIVKQHYIKGIIGLPPNIFFGTGIPASIIIIDKKNKDSRKGIFFIDAKDGFKKDGAKNRLREQDIKRIVDAWNAQQPIDHYCRLVEWSEIERNDYNLNIPRYIQPKDTEIQHDIEAHLHGGLPAHDVDDMQDYWNACPSLKVSLFKNDGNGYYSLKPEKADVAQTVEHDPSYISQNERFSALLNEWKAEIMPQMKAVGQGARPMELITSWSESLLTKAKEHSGLVDAYEVYDVLLNYWADVLQDDCYMIANDGWTYPEVKAYKPGKGDKKKSIMYDEIVCDLVPVSIVLAEYFTTETTEIAELSSSIESLQQELSYLVESNTDVFRFGDEDDEDKPVNVKIADVKKAIKNAKTDGTSKEDLEILKLWELTCTKKEGYVSQWKQKRAELTEAVVAKYAALTEDEIKMLVVERKWLASIIGGCEALMQNVTHQIASDVTALAERYEVTLGATESKVNDLEQEVLRSLKEMGFTL